MEEEILKLIRQTQKGDKQAYGEIYKIYVKKIYRFVYFLVYERELAEDLTQMAFLKAWVSLYSYNPKRGTFQSYLFAIARNLVIDYKRRKKEISLEDIPEPVSSFEVDKEIIQSENIALVKLLLGHLDSEEKQLISLRYFEEFKFTEIGRILKQTEGAVRIRLHRVLKKLRQIVKGKNYGC